ncbi:uncharacterized protein PITG_18150 [Phytophthora infestans T30-4]|uniref:Uncharacterized protein n=1 Tax=Phytophthora infestans (strain T30-4) TaxID=403677 RepID=D0NX49_PHYIT|nr:uncharacterized protein PITG_18150 [Phytophthora infestans T30-4]EEY67644.1 hypothetical protein PITG_18150 [Phytophthora infestans T30-4]|eukprot:XP_002896307.1 hypothetical protein PITG_18150 [Phytophthora infestans T30-4]
MLRASDRDRLYLLVRRVSGLEEQPPIAVARPDQDRFGRRISCCQCDVMVEDDDDKDDE